MALSQTESQLLEETCKNMNVAANTCRDVLEIVRSLGNSGVVDIATHNNSSSAHANSGNLVHIDDNVMHLGNKNSLISDWSDRWPFQIKYSSNFNNYYIDSSGVSKGITSSALGHTFNFRFALTDSSLNLLSETSAKTAGCPSNPRMFFLNAIGSTSDTSTTAGLSLHIGTREDGASYKKSSIGLWLHDDTTNLVNTFEFTDSYFSTRYNLTVSLGRSGHPFDTAYLRTAATVTSDRRGKTDISSLGSSAVAFVKALQPVEFKLAQGKTTVNSTDENGDATDVAVTGGTRTHWGFIAQDVKNAMTAAGIEDAAVWALADKDDPESQQALRYEELIAPLVKTVQVLAAKVEALEAR